MTEILDILAIVSPVFLVIGIGCVLGRAGFVDERANAAFSRLVFFVAAPALLFRSTARTPLQEALQPDILLVTGGVSALVAGLIYAAATRTGPARRGVLAQGAHRSNMVFFGLPVIVYAYGNEVLGGAAVLIGFMVVVYNFLAVLLLILPHRSGSSGGGVWGRTLLEMVRNPLILACAGGLLVSAAGLGLPLALDRTLELVGHIAAPLALIAVGAGLDFRRLRAEIPAAAAASIVKLLVYPALVLAGLHLVGAGKIDREVTVIIMAAPTAVVSAIMAREMKGDEQLAAAIVIGTTLAALVTTSAWLAYFRLAG